MTLSLRKDSPIVIADWSDALASARAYVASANRAATLFRHPDGWFYCTPGCEYKYRDYYCCGTIETADFVAGRAAAGLPADRDPRP